MKQRVSFVCLVLLLLTVPTPVFAADSDIVINEFQVEPSGSAQWVELYNKGNETIDLSGWSIDDSGGSDAFTVSSVSLSSHNCFSFQSSTFHLNTATADTVQLFHNGSLVDSHAYERSPGVNMSLGRAPDGEGTWITFSVPTRDGLNADGTTCASPTPTPSPTITKTPTPTKVPTPTKTPTPEKTPTPTLTKASSSTGSTLPTTKTGTLGSSTSRPTPTPDYHVPTAVLPSSSKNRSIAEKPSEPEQNVRTQGIAGVNLSYLFIGAGVSIIGSCGILVYLRHKNSQKEF